jgi:hypothetical protein
MPVVFEPEYEALWHMFAEDSTTVAEKNRALLVGGAFFYQVIVPAVANPTTKDFLMRGSPGQRARWLGFMCHAMGYRSDTAAADYDAAKDIANMPRMDYSAHPSNWRKASRNIDAELCDEVHSFLNGLTMMPDWAPAMLTATGQPAQIPSPPTGGAEGAGAAAAAGFGTGPGGTLSLDPASITALTGSSKASSDAQERATRMAAASHPDVRAKVAAGEISDPLAVHDMMMDPAGKANFEGKDFSLSEGESAADAEEKAGNFGTEILKLKSTNPAHLMAQQTLLLGGIMGCDPSCLIHTSYVSKIIQ